MNSIKVLRSLRKLNVPSKITRRRLGAGQPESQSMQARLWEGHSTHPEGWETTIYATYAAATVIITMALGFTPDTTINTWAMNEAQVRLNLKESGKLETEVFGTHYNTPEKVGFFSEWDKFQEKASNPEDDDDDDDEDDEDDEASDDEEGEDDDE